MTFHYADWLICHFSDPIRFAYLISDVYSQRSRRSNTHTQTEITIHNNTGVCRCVRRVFRSSGPHSRVEWSPRQGNPFKSAHSSLSSRHLQMTLTKHSNATHLLYFEIIQSTLHSSLTETQVAFSYT